MKTGDRIYCVRKGSWMNDYTIGKEYEVLSSSYRDGEIEVANDRGYTYYLDPQNFKLIKQVNIKDDYQIF
jgi:hypothetical protein